MRFIVSGRPQQGDSSATHRAGRRWPREGTLVEVVDQDDDPALDPAKPSPVRIGKKSWEALKADKVLVHIVPEGEAHSAEPEQPGEVVRLRAQVQQLLAENAKLRGDAPSVPTPPAAEGEPPAHPPKKAK